MDKIDKIIKIIPGLTAAAFLISLVYNYGYFIPFGRDWLSILTVKDMISLTWGSLPVAALGWALYAYLGPISGAKSLESLSEKPTPEDGRFRIFLKYAFLFGALLSFLFPFIVYLFAQKYITPETFLQFSPLIFLLHIWSLIHLYKISPGKDPDRARLGGALYTAIVWVMFMGAYSGYIAASTSPKYLATLTDGSKQCSTLVFAGDRALLFYDKSSSEIRLLRWDAIKYVTQGKPCSNPPKPTTPST